LFLLTNNRKWHEYQDASKGTLIPSGSALHFGHGISNGLFVEIVSSSLIFLELIFLQQSRLNQCALI
jgi:hypothetical protein